MTREQFITRWRRHVAGTIVLGRDRCRPIRKGHLQEAHQAGEIVYSLAAEVDELLGKLFDSLQAEEVPKPRIAK